MTEHNFSEFRSIRQVAAAGVLSEHHLRLLLAQGKLPGIYSGNRFKVNMRLLAEQLDKESAEAAQKGASVIVCAGTSMSRAVYDAQRDWKDVRFLAAGGRTGQ